MDSEKIITFVPMALGSPSHIDCVKQELGIGEKLSDYLCRTYDNFFSKILKKAGDDFFQVSREEAKQKIDELLTVAVDQAEDLKYIMIGGVLVIVIMAGSCVYLLHHTKEILRKQAEDGEKPKLKKIKEVKGDDGVLYVKKEKITAEEFEEILKKNAEGVVDAANVAD